MMKWSNGKISALLALCAWNSPVTGEFPAQSPVTRSFDVFFHLCLNENYLIEAGWRIAIIASDNGLASSEGRKGFHEAMTWSITDPTVRRVWHGLAPSYHLSQCLNVVYYTHSNKLQLNLNRNSYISSHENTFENVVWKVSAILSWPQYVYGVNIEFMCGRRIGRTLGQTNGRWRWRCSPLRHRTRSHVQCWNINNSIIISRNSSEVN